MNLAARYASEVLLGGGVVAYPTEGVFGLGCLPDDIDAVERILRIKQRSPRKGLILIAARSVQLDAWIDPAVGGALPEPDLQQPVTWIVRPFHSKRSPVSARFSTSSRSSISSPRRDASTPNIRYSLGR